MWIATFNTTRIDDYGWYGMLNRNKYITLCLASELGEESENFQTISNGIQKLDAPSTISRSNTSALHKKTTGNSPQNGVPIVSKPRSKPSLEKLTLNQIMYRAGKRGLGGGIPGAIAGAFQVLSLMWLRTIINYQSRYGTTFMQALRTLLNEGGVARLYCGVGFALIQAPLARFVSTAANDGVESLLANLSVTKNWGPGRTTVVASIVVGFWRMLLMRKF